MSKVYGPDTYVVKLNDSGKPSLYGPDGTTPIDDPVFQAFGDGSFSFTIADATGQTGENSNVLFFTDQPISWNQADRPGNTHRLANPTTLILDVSHPATWLEAQVYHFKLHFNQGDVDDVLWSHDGTVILDPTIVENPPNG